MSFELAREGRRTLLFFEGGGGRRKEHSLPEAKRAERNDHLVRAASSYFVSSMLLIDLPFARKNTYFSPLTVVYRHPFGRRAPVAG